MIQLVTFFLAASPAQAEELRLPALSPRATVTQQVGVVDVTVDYSSPGARDRQVWGELVPYGEIWRTGANAATTLEVGADVKVAGEELPAGRYSVFTIPGEDSWTVILNEDPHASTGSYDEKRDALRVEVKPEQAPARERLTFLFSDTDADSTRLDLEWAGLRVGVPIEVDTPALVGEGIAVFAKRVGGDLADAARYRAESGDLQGALALVDASLATEQTWYNTFLKADILHQMGQNKEAYKLAKAAHDLGQKADYFFWKARVEKALAEWKKR